MSSIRTGSQYSKVLVPFINAAFNIHSEYVQYIKNKWPNDEDFERILQSFQRVVDNLSDEEKNNILNNGRDDGYCVYFNWRTQEHIMNEMSNEECTFLEIKAPLVHNLIPSGTQIRIDLMNINAVGAGNGIVDLNTSTSTDAIERICAFCYGVIEEESNALMLKCQHLMHTECDEHWRQIQNNEPGIRCPSSTECGSDYGFASSDPPISPFISQNSEPENNINNNNVNDVNARLIDNFIQNSVQTNEIIRTHSQNQTTILERMADQQARYLESLNNLHQSNNASNPVINLGNNPSSVDAERRCVGLLARVFPEGTVDFSNLDSLLIEDNHREGNAAAQPLDEELYRDLAVHVQELSRLDRSNARERRERNQQRNQNNNGNVDRQRRRRRLQPIPPPSGHRNNNNNINNNDEAEGTNSVNIEVILLQKHHVKVKLTQQQTAMEKPFTILSRFFPVHLQDQVTQKMKNQWIKSINVDQNITKDEFLSNTLQNEFPKFYSLLDSTRPTSEQLDFVVQNGNQLNADNNDRVNLLEERQKKSGY